MSAVAGAAGAWGHVQFVLQAPIRIIAFLLNHHSPIGSVSFVIWAFLLDLSRRRSWSRVFRISLLIVSLTTGSPLLMMGVRLGGHGRCRSRCGSGGWQGVRRQSQWVRAQFCEVAEASQLVSIDFKLLYGLFHPVLLGSVPVGVDRVQLLGFLVDQVLAAPIGHQAAPLF